MAPSDKPYTPSTPDPVDPSVFSDDDTAGKIEPAYFDDQNVGDTHSTDHGDYSDYSDYSDHDDYGAGGRFDPDALDSIDTFDDAEDYVYNGDPVARSIYSSDVGPAGFPLSEGDRPPGQPFYDGAETAAPPRSRARGFLYVLAGLLSVAAVVGIGAFAGFYLMGSGDQPTDHARSSQAAATQPAQPSGSETASPTTSSTSKQVPPPVDPTFSWWGDGVSVQAARWKPVIGTAGHDYAWHASNSLEYGPQQAIEDIRKGIAGDSNQYVGGTVVFAYGTAAEVTEGELDQLSQVLGDRRGLILVGVGSSTNDIPWRDAVNARYKALADKRPNTRYVDWQAAIDSNPNLVHDGFIPTQSGAAKWAGLVNAALDSLYSSGGVSASGGSGNST